jgi:hypothetical protein
LGREAQTILRPPPTLHPTVDNLKRALLTHHNTPDRNTGLSPAQAIFGHPIREILSIKPNLWLLTRDMREPSIARRQAKQEDRLTKHTEVLHGLKISDMDLVQNQSGPHTIRWDRLGTMTETLPHNQHKVKTNGSGRVTLRNRKFLDSITAYTTPPTRSYTTTQTPLTQWCPPQRGRGEKKQALTSPAM